MKMMTLAAVAAIALGGLTAAPALAQPPGHDMHGDNMRHDDNNRRHDDMRRDNDRGHRWNNHHRRQVCHWVRRHHHRERVCSWR